MDEQEFTHSTDGEELRTTVVAPDGDPRPGTALLLHGAGVSSSRRLLPLARAYAAAGLRAVAFDFSGHGASTGRLAELSLERRFLQARSVLDRFAGDGPLLLAGFSMSGQTVADLAADLGERVHGVVLGAPAAYVHAAWKLPFGDPAFTATLRTPDSWRASPAYPSYAAFRGRSVLVVPAHDAVIPSGVTTRIEDALRQRSTYSRLTFPNSPHQLATWLADHPADRDHLVGLSLAPADGRPQG
ncbi:alpha/beta hydrolase [Kitasatospora cinereorecta]|uniref:Alpha/beta hydrolase n=1 Tax=Kitasatospora cinereorecta TaxID=285560 RepID=A0ABW0VG80_9ACTN